MDNQWTHTRTLAVYSDDPARIVIHPLLCVVPKVDHLLQSRNVVIVHLESLHSTIELIRIVRSKTTTQRRKLDSEC